MGVMPVAKLLLTMSVPMMISMLVQALYNIVDSMFVAKSLSPSLPEIGSDSFSLLVLLMCIAVRTYPHLLCHYYNMKIIHVSIARLKIFQVFLGFIKISLNFFQLYDILRQREVIL